MLDLIEKVSNTQYPFQLVENRPHLTSYIPVGGDLLDNENTSKLRAEINLSIYPHIYNYMDKHNLNSLESRPNILISKLTQGKEMPAHIECDKNNRTFFFDLYLNEDYDGGSLFFDELNLIIKPTAGLLVIAPGKYVHGVSKLTSGTRFSIGSGFFE